MTVDRREQINALDDLSREQIIDRLDNLKKQYPQAFVEGEYQEVKDGDSRVKLLEADQEKSA